MRDIIISRAEVLIEQKKYKEAEKLLRELLAEDPNNFHLLSLLSGICLQQDKIEQASELIDSAIALSPDVAHLFYLKARVEIEKDEYDAAEENLRTALELDPEDADFYALWASIKLTRKQFENSLELANKALELDAENTLGLNIRSTALLKLNRPEDSFKTIEGALREDPNNAYTHSTYGWNLLEKGDHKKALEHFKEALKSDPNFTYAQAGMVEALKANNLFYKLFLKYSFWISNLTAKYQWAVIIGFYLGFKAIRTISEKYETLQPYLNPLIILLGIIAFSTWIIQPVSNLFLRLNKFGKHLLDKKEIMSSNFVGICFLIFLAGGACYFALADDRFLSITAFGFAMMLPCGVMFSPTKYKNSLVIYTGIMAFVGVMSIAGTFQTGEMYNGYTSIFLIGFIAFQWGGQFFNDKAE